MLIDDDRFDRLEAEAARRGVAVAVIVREAIDAAYPEGAHQRLRAAQDLLEASPMEVPDPGDLRAELEDLRGRRA